MNAPKYIRRMSYLLRTRVEQDPNLLSSDKMVARAIAFAPVGPFGRAITRIRIALRTGLSIRTVSRSIGRLARAGLIEIEERGRIEDGQHYQQVYRVLFDQVSPRDTATPPSGDLRGKTRRAGTRRTRRTLLDVLSTARTPTPTRPDLAIPLF